MFIVMLFAALRFTVFLDLRCTNCHFCRCSLFHCISRGHLPELRIVILIAIIPLIDAASNDDSNGGHIVFWSNLDLCCEIRALGSNPAVLGGKFDHF